MRKGGLLEKVESAACFTVKTGELPIFDADDEWQAPFVDIDLGVEPERGPASIGKSGSRG